MRNQEKRFLQILEIELEDLKEDIDSLIEEYQREHASGKSTDYVYLNNLATFRNEERGIDHFIGIIRSLDSSAFEGIEPLIEHCRVAFRDTIRSCGLPPFIEALVDRKIVKVKSYVTA